MQSKYFYYISPTKVDILEPQLRKWAWPKITPTVKMPGIDLQVQAAETQVPTILAARLVSVVDALTKAGKLGNIESAHDLQNGAYYHDHDMWYSGLFSFKGIESLHSGPLRAVSYLLWRPRNDSIILLAGSPLHILGEKNVRDSLWAGGTSGTWQWMLEFALTCLKTDEDTLIGVGQNQPADARKRVKWVDWDPVAWDEKDEEMPVEMSVSPDALAIAILCIRYLSRLPLSRVETVFTVFDELAMRRRVNLPAWTRAILDAPGLDEHLRETLLKCKTVYIGSPLYTALG
jgi:hypothetical protein